MSHEAHSELHQIIGAGPVNNQQTLRAALFMLANRIDAHLEEYHTAPGTWPRCLHGYTFADRTEQCDLKAGHDEWHRWTRGQDAVRWPKDVP